MSSRITAYSAARTWGGLRPYLYVAAFAGVLWVGTHVHDGGVLGHGLFSALALGLVAAIELAYPRCPRCAHHLFGRNGDGTRRLLRPRQRCGKCNLDLTRYGPSDPRAKKE